MLQNFHAKLTTDHFGTVGKYIWHSSSPVDFSVTYNQIKLALYFSYRFLCNQETSLTIHHVKKSEFEHNSLRFTSFKHIEVE